MAAVESPTATVESATTVVAATRVPMITASDIAVRGTTSVRISWPISIPRPIAVTRAVSPTRTPVPAVSAVAVTPVTVIPGTCADKHAAHKVAQTPIAVGRTSIRIIRVITVSTNWLWSDARDHRPDSHAHRNLCVRSPRG